MGLVRGNNPAVDYSLLLLKDLTKELVGLKTFFKLLEPLGSQGKFSKKNSLYRL